MPVVTEEQQKTRKRRIWPFLVGLLGTPAVVLGVVFSLPWTRPVYFVNLGLLSENRHGIIVAVAAKKELILRQQGNTPSPGFEYEVAPSTGGHRFRRVRLVFRNAAYAFEWQ